MKKTVNCPCIYSSPPNCNLEDKGAKRNTKFMLVNISHQTILGLSTYIIVSIIINIESNNKYKFFSTFNIGKPKSRF